MSRTPFFLLAVLPVGLLALVLGSLAPLPLAAAEDDDARMRYGRHLASECTSCHRLDGKEGGGAIPSLAGRPAEEIIALLADYRAGRKTNPVMVSVAKSLDDEQTAALAAYFCALPKPPTPTGKR